MPYPPVDELAAAGDRRAADQPSGPETALYSSDERRFLLSVARQAIDAAIAKREFYPEPLTARVAEPRGVFTTLHIGEQLRGCVGQIVAVEPLVRAVAHTAVSAAFNDPRFTPLTAAELPLVRIELSVLSPLAPILPEEIEIGRHGLLVTLGHNRGLLLPQVAGEYGWDAPTFLAQTCRKAGLPPDAWRLPGAQVHAFTVELFGE